MTIYSYRDLIVWQRSMALVTAIYTLTSKFPPEERYGLTSQLRRAAVSISSNIAEGRYRGSRKDFIQFLRIAYASSAEIETQLLIAQKVVGISIEDYTRVSGLLNEVAKMLHSMIKKMNPVLSSKSS